MLQLLKSSVLAARSLHAKRVVFVVSLLSFYQSFTVKVLTLKRSPSYFLTWRVIPWRWEAWRKFKNKSKTEKGEQLWEKSTSRWALTLWTPPSRTCFIAESLARSNAVWPAGFTHRHTHTHRISGSRITGRTHKRGERLLKSRHQYQGVVFGCSFQILCFDKNICDKLLKFNFNSAELIPALSQKKKHQLLKIESYWCVLLYFHFWQALKELKSSRGCVCQPWLGPATVLVLDIGAGSASEQLQRALLLAAIGGRVQRGVPQQICAVDVWRLLPAELQQTHGTRRDERPGPLNVLPPLFIVLLRAEARFFDFSHCASRSCCSRCCSSFFSDCRPVGGYCLLNNSTCGKVYFSLPSFHE